MQAVGSQQQRTSILFLMRVLLTSVLIPILNFQHFGNAFETRRFTAVTLKPFPLESLPIFANTWRQHRDLTSSTLLLASMEPGHESNLTALSSLSSKTSARASGRVIVQEFMVVTQLLCMSLVIALMLVTWEDVSMAHPMRQEQYFSSSLVKPASLWGRSTVHGMAFGRQERLAFSVAADLESSEYRDLPSYNEVMLQHRKERVSLWKKQGVPENEITRDDVIDSVKQVQLALLQLQDCKQLIRDYEWNKLRSILSYKTFRSDLESSCYLLQGADPFLTLESRQVIGFDWGSCGWRHCGALADAQEALDELDQLLGVLEPFECLFCLDIVERSLRDILEVTAIFQNTELRLKIPSYQPLHRMSDVNEENYDGFETDFMDTLIFLKNTAL
jgi:hypothetical protein